MKTIKQAINHFMFKLNPKNNIWKATQKDADAINEIIEFVESKHRQQLNSNELFAKLYITLFGELLKYYNCSVFDPTPQKAINKILDTPIEVIIQKFIDKANITETGLQMEEAGIEIKDIRLKSIEQIEKETDYFSMDMLEPQMTYDEAVKNLEAMINFAINEYS